VEPIVLIRSFSNADLDWVLALNATFEVQLSPLTRDRLAELVELAFVARVADDEGGFLIAFDQDADYASPNFLWFKPRLRHFVYVDRIAVNPMFRGQGTASTLYRELFEVARAAGRDRIVCEVNMVPPNPASDAFHARLGFREVGRAELSASKIVRYLEMRL
jgi:hypothetical protein